MGREKRLQYENAWYHVMNRAAGRKFVFSDENNKFIFFELINDICKKHQIEIHAYCLMSNHYHLLIKTPRANLSEAMHYLQNNFSKRYNKIICSDGPVFKSRYKSILIKNDSYLIQVCRYIHLNPVEANLSSGINYNWSSYQYYIHNSLKPYWLVTDELLNMISTNKNTTSFTDFHKQDNSEALKKFYKKTITIEVAELNLELEDTPINLNALYNLTNDINKNTKLSKFIFCFLARYVYDYKIIEISSYLKHSTRSTIASLLSRNK